MTLNLTFWGFLKLFLKETLQSNFWWVICYEFVNKRWDRWENHNNVDKFFHQSGENNDDGEFFHQSGLSLLILMRKKFEQLSVYVLPAWFANAAQNKWSITSCIVGILFESIGQESSFAVNSVPVTKTPRWKSKLEDEIRTP